MKKIITIVTAVVIVTGMFAVAAQAAEMKIGYIDLRRAFYEYEKSKSFDEELRSVTEERDAQRNQMIEELRKMRDESEFLGDPIIATAILDRLLHHCHVIQVKGNSYRMKSYQDKLNRDKEGK